jgi:hypothetical protein
MDDGADWNSFPKTEIISKNGLKSVQSARMQKRLSILLSAALLVAAILLVFRNELHARGPRTECGYWGDMDAGMSCR